MIKSIIKLNQMFFWSKPFLHIFCIALLVLQKQENYSPMLHAYRKGKLSQNNRYVSKDKEKMKVAGYFQLLILLSRTVLGCIRNKVIKSQAFITLTFYT